MRSLLLTAALLTTPLTHAAEVLGTITSVDGQFRSGAGQDFTPTACSVSSRTFQNQLAYYANVATGDFSSSNAFQFYGGDYAGLPATAPDHAIQVKSPGEESRLRYQDGTLSLQTSKTSRSVGTGVTTSLGGWIGGEHQLVLTTDKTTVIIQGAKARFILHRYYGLVPVKIAEAECALAKPLF